ncbi:hypothetical protein D9M68_648960 [compost metagenome]
MVFDLGLEQTRVEAPCIERGVGLCIELFAHEIAGFATRRGIVDEPGALVERVGDVRADLGLAALAVRGDQAVEGGQCIGRAMQLAQHVCEQAQRLAAGHDHGSVGQRTELGDQLAAGGDRLAAAAEVAQQLRLAKARSGAFGGMLQAREQRPGVVQLLELLLCGGLDYIHLRFLVWRAPRGAGRNARTANSARDPPRIAREFAPSSTFLTQA